MKYKLERRLCEGQVLRRVHSQLGVYTRLAGRENEKGFNLDLLIADWSILALEKF